MKNTCHTFGPPAPQPLEVEKGSSRHGDNQTLTLPPPQRGGPDGPAWEAQKSWMRVGSRMNEPGTLLRAITCPVDKVLPSPASDGRPRSGEPRRRDGLGHPRREEGARPRSDGEPWRQRTRCAYFSGCTAGLTSLKSSHRTGKDVADTPARPRMERNQ
ncbi:hypothetical protein ILYODFUR_038517 [Ilyodon furcidens]|uniref:Uncharacterized protein n=1 Tax=Ilyodon furcidens TaxID=33524 RepID=A0ABV0TU50_9TELE